jgi:hypothetical protein
MLEKNTAIWKKCENGTSEYGFHSIQGQYGQIFGGCNEHVFETSS